MTVLTRLLKSTFQISRPFIPSNKFSSTRERNKSSSDVPNGHLTDLRKDVTSLYKNLIYLSREWPTDLRPQIKRAFMKNKDVQDVEEVKKLIERGEYICREIIATYHLRKYRAMKRRYYTEDSEKHFDDIIKDFN